MQTIRRKLAFILMLTVLCVAFCACGKDPAAGIYYSCENGEIITEDWLELKSNGTWKDSEGFGETYTIEGNVITLYLFEAPMMNGTIEDGHIVFESEYYNLEYYHQDKLPQ